MLDKIFPQSSEILKLMGEALLVVDAGGIIRSVTPPAVELFGTEPEALIGTHFGVPVTAGDFSELDVISKTGDIRIVQMRSISAAYEGEPVHVLTLRDVTAQKRLEEELQKAREGALAADRAKSNFLANMTHEIRTPMIGVLGMTELTLATKLAPKQREYLEMVRHSAGSLLEILNDILDYAKIETGALELADQPFDLPSTVEDAIRVFLPLAEKKGIKLSWFVAKDAPSALSGDASRLRQILVNLVGNAVKFTDMGMVRVEVTLAKGRREDGQVRLFFSVQDTGIGIPQDKLGAIFDSFTQADGSTSRRYQGAGLGLSIFKHLVDMMGGEVGVRSEEGRGSAFTFTLPLRLAPETETVIREAPAASALPPMTILLAEDNPVNQIFISELLEQQGHRVIKAHTGRRAIKALKERDVDVVLMDIQMPEMDGIEATRIIRQSAGGHIKPDIPIIALTAHALKGDRERFLKAGMDDYLAKPVGLEELQASLARVLERKAAPAPSGGSREPVSPAPADRRAGPAQAPDQPDQSGQPKQDESLETLDYPWLLEKARGNTEFLARLFAAFVTDQPKTLAAITAALAARDMERLGFLAHSLKGASATMGARKLRAACLALEQSAKAGREDGLEAELKDLKENMNQVVDVMKGHLENQGEAPAPMRAPAPAMAR